MTRPSFETAWPALLWTPAVLMWSSPAGVGAVDMSRAAPRGTAAALFLEPLEGNPPGGDRASGIRLAAFLWQRARESGCTLGLGTRARLTADAVACLPLVARYPVGVVLLEVRSRELAGGGSRLADLRGGLVLQTERNNGPVVRRIQELLNLYTSQAHSKIIKRQDDATTAFVLTDDRLPEWAVIEWGEVGDEYVVAIGNGAFAEIARAVQHPDTSLQAEAWFAAAHRACKGSEAYFEVYVDIEELRAQLGRRMTDRVDRVATGLRCEDLQRGLWTVGQAGRRVNVSCVLGEAGWDRPIPLTAAAEQNPKAAAVIPPEATTYAILNVRPRDLVLRARDGYLAARSESTRRRLRRLWEEHLDGPDWSVEADLLEPLGDCVVIHNAPPHPLGIPLLGTILVRIEGSSEKVGASFDRLFAALQKYLTPAPGGRPGFVLRRAPDGVWYVQMGLYGPALAVTQGWVVISYAPDAVRRNVRFLQDGAGGSPAAKPAAGVRPPGAGVRPAKGKHGLEPLTRRGVAEATQNRCAILRAACQGEPVVP